MLVVRLLGSLGRTFIKEISLDVATVTEAIAALRANFPGFADYVYESEQAGIVYKVRVGYQEIDETQLNCPIAKKVRTISISPIPGGAGGGFGKILLGAALLGLGLAGVGFLGLSASTIAITGGALLLSGLSSLFGRVNDPATDGENKTHIFGSPKQTVAEGGRIPVVYGIHLTGHYVLSAGIRSYLTA